MNCRIAQLSQVIAVALMLCFAVPVVSFGQERDDKRKNRGDQPIKRRTLQLVDGADQPNRGAAKITNNGDIRTTTTVDRGRDVKITEDPNQGIVVEVIQHFNSQQLNRLKDQHPELRDYIDLFPTKTGDHEIELSISLKKRFEAPNAQKLKVKSLFAFGIYKRHVERHGDHMAKFQ